MCVVAVKYLPSFGWVGCKNRDRNYLCRVHIVQSNRHGLQRLFLDDQTSRWSEGVNEHGVCIISASFSVKSDEKEGEKILSKKKTSKKHRDGTSYSPDGVTIRQALRHDNPMDALKILVERELAGATYVFDEDRCFLLEGGFTVKKKNASDDNPREYIYKVSEISKEDGHSARTNHGINLPQLGYSSKTDDPYYLRARESSEKRLAVVDELLPNVKSPDELMDALSACPNDDAFMNPIRKGDPKKGDMVTTGQIMLTSKVRTMHYRPIYSTVEFTYDRLNGEKAKTFFEIVSNRRLLSFTEWFMNALYRSGSTLLS